MSVTKEILRICVCDNEEAELLLLEQTLQNVMRERLFPWSLEICVCRDWEGVLNACRTNTCHLIILDIEMPGMNGFEMAQRLCCLDQHSG